MAYDTGSSEHAPRTIGMLPRVSTRASRRSSVVTLADVLQLPAVATTHPVVLGGGQWLSRTISGLRIVDRLDARELPVAGEVVLLAAHTLLSGPDELRRYITDLAAQEAVGVMVELGHGPRHVPGALVGACERRGLPVIAMQQTAPLEQVAWAVDSAVLRAKQTLLEARAASHERFTELSLDDASLPDLVTATAELAGAAVVFADVLHRVVAMDARGGSAEDLVARWQRQELHGDALYGTAIDEEAAAVTVRVETKHHLRGRLTLFATAPIDPTQVAVLERAAAAIAMRLNHVEDGSIWADAKRSLVVDLLTSGTGAAEAAAARAASLGHAIGTGVMAVVLIRSDADVGDHVARAFARPKVDALTGALGPGLWGVLVLLPDPQDEVVDRAADKLQLLAASAGKKVTVARGGYVDDIAGIRRSYDEAVEVAQAVHGVAVSAHHRGCHTIRDVGLRGLLVALRQDSRVQAFAERMLRPLMDRDRREAGDWVHTLAVYLRFGGNKSMAAIELGISRQTLYQRLSRIERMLDVDIDDSETRTSLHAAVMTLEGAGSSQPAISPEIRPVPGRAEQRRASP